MTLTDDPIERMPSWPTVAARFVALRWRYVSYNPIPHAELFFEALALRNRKWKTAKFKLKKARQA